MGMARILGFCIAFLFASSVAASTIDVGPSNWRNYGPSATHTTGGVQSTFGQNVRLPPTVSGPTRILPVSRNAVIPYGSIVNGAKNLVRVNPASVAASAAITALFLGLDWVFDPELDSWAVEEIGEIVDPELGIWSATVNQELVTGPSAEYVCRSGIQIASSANPSVEGFSRVQTTGSHSASCYAYYNGNPNFNLFNMQRAEDCPPGSTHDNIKGVCVFPDGFRPIIEGDWEELAGYLPSAPPGQVAEAASDLQRRQGGPLPGYTDLQMSGPDSFTGPSSTSTSTDPVTGDTTITETTTQSYVDYGDTTITTTNTTTTTTYQNGQETSTTVTTETPGELPVSSGGGGAAGDWPGFCEWASVVCDWFNWTQEEPPPEQDLPSVIDDDFYQEKTISFGAKSCPPDHQIDLTPFLATSVAVSFQPLCDFAGLIYYMVMAASYIIAAYITIGVARNG